MLRDLLPRALSVTVVTVVTAIACKKSDSTNPPSGSASSTSATSATSVTSASSVTAKSSAAVSANSIASAAPSTSASALAAAPVPETPFGIACNDYASSRCAALDKCSHHLLSVSDGDVAACEANAVAVCLSSMGLPESGWTPATITACATASREASCDVFFHAPALGSCAPPKGKLAAAASCISDEQCADRFCVRASIRDVCGKCATPPGNGMPCDKQRCAEGLACVSGKCAVRGELGGACAGTGTSGSCQPWLSCVSGKCAAPITTTSEDASKKCSILGDAPDCDGRLGLFCDIAASQCKAMNVAKKGESCTSEKGELRICAGGLLCRRADGASASTCVPQPHLGDACDITMGLRCAAPSRCLDGKCVVPSMSACAK